MPYAEKSFRPPTPTPQEWEAWWQIIRGAIERETTVRELEKPAATGQEVAAMHEAAISLGW